MQGGEVSRHRFSAEVGHVRGGRVQWVFEAWKHIWKQDGLRGDSLEATMDRWMCENRERFQNSGVWWHGPQAWDVPCSLCIACGCPEGMCPECMDP